MASSSPLISSTHICWSSSNSSILVKKHQHIPITSSIICPSSPPLLSCICNKSRSSCTSIHGTSSGHPSHTLADNISDQHLKSKPNNSDNVVGGIIMNRSIAAFLMFCLSTTVPYMHMDSNNDAAKAVLYSPDTKVLPRTGEFALRRAIPANANMKAIQDSLEDISYLLRIPQRKPYGTMESNVKKALKIAIEEKESIMRSIPEESKEKGSLLYNSLISEKGGLPNLIQFIKQNDADKVSVGLTSSLDTLAEIEILQSPGLSFLLPQQYLNYPRLTGRGTVEFTIEKGAGSTFFPTTGGQPQDLAKIQVVLDGYSAPLTAGNIAKLVIDGAYDGVAVKCTDQAVLVNGNLENSGYSVPLEVMPSGQFEPLYKTTLSIQDGELPVLPLSVFGSVAMAHSADSEEYSSPSQFFFYLYDKRNSGLGGLAFDEGQFSVFGYVTTGREVLSQIKSGDVIRSAKLIDGRDRLILPAQS